MAMHGVSSSVKVAHDLGLSGGSDRPASRAFCSISEDQRSGIWARAPRSVAMAMVGQKTEEVYRRYAIVDEAMIREAAMQVTRGAKVRRTTAQRTAQSDQPSADR
jgi:hypothetical protein